MDGAKSVAIVDWFQVEVIAVKVSVRGFSEICQPYLEALASLSIGLPLPWLICLQMVTGLRGQNKGYSMYSRTAYLFIIRESR